MAPKDKKNKVVLKNPKGTRDWSDDDVSLLKDILNRIESVLRLYSKNLETPVFELAEVLKGKYGEDSKLIYDLKDNKDIKEGDGAQPTQSATSEALSLRYDLTVPFARWLAMNPNLSEYSRYAIGKVYRRDQPAISKGRMREFYQCDIDFAGGTSPIMVDARVLDCIVQVFEELEWKGKYKIKLNDRRILDGLFEVCGVPQDKIRTISSAVDKLDKSPWQKVKEEMVEQKGLDEAVADKIGAYVNRKAGNELLEDIAKDEALLANTKAKEGIEHLQTLFQWLKPTGALEQVSFDLSLARGLDYYTGLIYEVVTEGSAPAIINEGRDPTTNGAEAQNGTSTDPSSTTNTTAKEGKKRKKEVNEDDDRSDDPSVGVGSVAAGGRYDTLVERFRPGANLPCVGVSFGVDRLFTITKARIAKGEKFSYVSSTSTDVFVMAFGGGGFSGMEMERFQVATMLSRAKLRAKTVTKKKPKPQAQFKEADESGARYAVILGEDEQAKGEARVKELGLPEGHPEKEGVLVKMDDLVKEVATRIEALKLQQ